MTQISQSPKTVGW